MPNPPDRFPLWIDLTPFTTPADRATALGNQYTNFFTQFGMYPTVAITVGNVVYFGAY